MRYKSKHIQQIHSQVAVCERAIDEHMQTKDSPFHNNDLIQIVLLEIKTLQAMLQIATAIRLELDQDMKIRTRRLIDYITPKREGNVIPFRPVN